MNKTPGEFVCEEIDPRTGKISVLKAMERYGKQERRRALKECMKILHDHTAINFRCMLQKLIDREENE